MNLTPQQMQFLADKGLSLADVIEFANLTPTRSKSAERQARYRARQKSEQQDDNVTSDVTRDASHRNANPPLSAPPNDIYSNPPHHTPPTHSLARDAFPRPDWCEPAVWSDLKRNRRAKKLANTATAHRQFLRDIAKMADDEWPPGRLVEAIVARGWGGAYDPRETEKPRQFNGKQQPKGGSLAGIGDKVRAAYGM